MSMECIWCGSKKIVTSITDCETMETLGWICKECYDKISLTEKMCRYMFGHEGWVDEHRTVWDVEKGE